MSQTLIIFIVFLKDINIFQRLHIFFLDILYFRPSALDSPRFSFFEDKNAFFFLSTGRKCTRYFTSWTRSATALSTQCAQFSAIFIFLKMKTPSFFDWQEIYKMFHELDSFYYSPSGDLTHCTQRRHLAKYNTRRPLWRRADDRFFWNKLLMSDLMETEVREKNLRFF